MEKKMYLVKNEAQGIDLVIERDAGNEFRVLTGNPKNSLKTWKKLSALCEGAILSLEDSIPVPVLMGKLPE